MFLKSTKFTIAALASAIIAGCAENTEDVTETDANTAPKIVLEGASSMTINVNEAFVEPGFIAFDEEDGNLTSEVQFNLNSVNTAVPGTYQVVYQVIDSGNMSAAVTVRTVHVVEGTSNNPGSSSSSSSSSGGNSTPVETANVPAITAFDLVAFTDTSEMLTVLSLEDGAKVNLFDLPASKVNIVASSEDAAATGSVHLKLQGPVEIDRWENNPIYTLEVEGENLDVTLGELPAGDYTLTATPYTLADMGGDAGAPVTTRFSVVEETDVEAPTGPEIAAIKLLAVPQEGEYFEISTLSQGQTLDLNELPTGMINFQAITTDEIETGSVEFKLTTGFGSTVLIDRYENEPDFTAENALEHIDIAGLQAGDYTLTATAYSLDDMAGDVGKSFVMHFTVKPFVVPTIFAFNDSYSVLSNSAFASDSNNSVGANDTFDALQAMFAVIDQPRHGSLTMDASGAFNYEPAAGFVGRDEFVYEIRQNDEVSQARVSIDVKAQVTPTEDDVWETDASGFTEIKTSPDSKTIYVSSSQGSDSNNCLSSSAPCKSLNAALEKMRSGYPDHVYLKRGDVWSNQTLNNVQSGRSAEEPAVVSFYGNSGPRPKIESTSRPLQVTRERDALHNLHFIGLEFSAPQLDPESPQFTGAETANIYLLFANSNILFEDNLFNHVEVIIQYVGDDRPSNIALRRNISTGTYVNSSSYNQNKRPSNAYLDGIDGILIEENVFDYGGWHPEVKGASANMYNHNVYMNTNNDGNRVTVRGNIFTRGSSHGIHGRSGGLFEDNFFARNAVSLQMGYNGKPLKAGVRATARNNVITEGMSMIKGVDPCVQSNLCTKAIWGLHIIEFGQGIFRVENNIISQGNYPGETGSYNRYGLLAKGDDSDVTYIGNIDWDWSSSASGSYPDPGRKLEDYSASLGHAKSFDTFMNIVLNREPQKWNDAYSAYSINDYIRAGFGK